MGSIRFLFFDLDGTLLDSRKRIHPELIRYLEDLKKRRNVLYGFSTGRHGMSVTPYIREYGLDHLFEGMVCTSGADIFCFSSGRHIKNHYMPADVVKTLIDSFKDYGFLACGYFTDSGFVAAGMNPTLRTLITRNYYSWEYLDEHTRLQPASRFLLLFDPKDAPKAAEAARLHSFAGLRSVMAESVCEYLDERNSKATGVSFFIGQYGLRMEDVMVFGDAENDRQIMEASGISVCMKNGLESIQALADYTTEKTNDENGIMLFLQQHEELLQELRGGT